MQWLCCRLFCRLVVHTLQYLALQSKPMRTTYTYTVVVAAATATRDCVCVCGRSAESGSDREQFSAEGSSIRWPAPSLCFSFVEIFRTTHTAFRSSDSRVLRIRLKQRQSIRLFVDCCFQRHIHNGCVRVSPNNNYQNISLSLSLNTLKRNRKRNYSQFRD